MTFDEFKEDILTFLGDSTVNLGRKATKTREALLSTIREKLDAFGDSRVCSPDTISYENKPDNKTLPTKKKVDIIRINPTECRKNSGAIKGAQVMTASESMKADEQHNNSPFVNQPKKEVDNG